MRYNKHGRSTITINTAICKTMKNVKFIAWLLVIIGGLNWGLIGFFQFNLITEIFGAMSTVARIVYALVGLSSLLLLFKKAN